MKYTRFNISESELVNGFGIELGFIDCTVNSLEKLIEAVDALTDEQFDRAMTVLHEE